MLTTQKVVWPAVAVVSLACLVKFALRGETVLAILNGLVVAGFTYQTINLFRHGRVR